MNINDFNDYFTIYVYYLEYYEENDILFDIMIPLVNYTREHFINVSMKYLKKKYMIQIII